MEKEKIELTSELFGAFRQLLIKLLGLDLVKYVWSDEDEPDENAYIPLSLLTARREVIEHFLKGMEEKDNIENALNDERFEKLSQAIANDTVDDMADMEPVVDIGHIDDILAWDGPVRQKELKMLGIKIVDHETKNDKDETKKVRSSKKPVITFDEND